MLPMNEGDLVEGTVRKWTEDGLSLQLADGRLAVLPDEERVHVSEGQEDPYPPGQHVWCVVLAANEKSVTVSHTKPALVQKLLALTIPAFRDGTVKVIGMARSRHHSKVALSSQADRAADSYIDTAARDALRHALGDKQLDFVLFQDDPGQFFAAAAGIPEVHPRFNKTANSLRVVIKDDEMFSDDLSLASMLTGKVFGVRSFETVPYSLFLKRQEGVRQALQKVTGVDASLAKTFSENGIESVEDLAKADEGALATSAKLDREKVHKAVDAARIVLKSKGPTPSAPDSSGLSPDILAMVAEARQKQELTMELSRKIKAKVEGIVDVAIAISGDSAVVNGVAKTEADREAAGRLILESGKVKTLQNSIRVGTQ